jgi:hypothetical protein
MCGDLLASLSARSRVFLLRLWLTCQRVARSTITINKRIFHRHWCECSGSPSLHTCARVRALLRLSNLRSVLHTVDITSLEQAKCVVYSGPHVFRIYKVCRIQWTSRLSNLQSMSYTVDLTSFESTKYVVYSGPHVCRSCEVCRIQWTSRLSNLQSVSYTVDLTSFESMSCTV